MDPWAGPGTRLTVWRRFKQAVVSCLGVLYLWPADSGKAEYWGAKAELAKLTAEAK